MMQEDIRADARGNQTGSAIALVLAGLFCMSLMDSLAKVLGEAYAIAQIVLLRNLFGLLPILVMVWRGGGLATVRCRQPLAQTLRIGFGLGAAFLFFHGLRFLPLAEAFAISFAGPLFITALSIPILGEKVGARRWAAVVVGFLGVLAILRPGADAFRIEALLPLGAALCYAMVMLITRRLSRSDSTTSILFWTALGSATVAGLLSLRGWSMPTPGDWGLFAAMGAAGTATMFCMASAYRRAQAAALAPFDYSILLWGLLLGWLIWHELPDPRIWPGAAVLVACGLYIIHRETRAPRAAATSPD